MKLRFRATLATKAYRDHEILSGENLVLLHHGKDDRTRIWKELFRINEKEKETGNEVELDVTINIAYKPRSVQMNKLMWSIYAILAEVMNRENKSRDKPITPQELHDEDMNNFAPRRMVFCSQGDEAFFKQVLINEYGKIIERKLIEGVVYFTILETTRYWNTKQMSDHIDRLFNTLTDMHVTNESNGDVDAIFRDYENWKKKEVNNGKADND